MTAAAHATCAGEVLEIGSYRGKSTVILARAGRFGDRPGIVAVDPLTYGKPEEMSVDESGRRHEILMKNLRDHGVESDVEFYQEYSQDLAQRWDRNLRLLWIDGDHTYEGAKRDVELFMPSLNKGAVVAMHDVSRHWEGPLRVFIEEILRSDQFGCCGVCGSIGYGQYIGDSAETKPHEARKRQLERKLLPILEIAGEEGRPRGLKRLMYRHVMKRMHNTGVTPAQWLSQMTFFSK